MKFWRAILLVALALLAGTIGWGSAHAAPESGFRFSRAVVQHLSTGFPLRGAHEVTRCESCHVRGVFKGTPKDCATCHGPGARISSVTMTAGHPVVTQPCTVCHNQISFSGIKFDHTNAMPGSCASCHNGLQASGKPLGHVATTQSCDSCHRATTLWSGATFDHASVRAGTCTSCHNGTNAKGKPSNHIVTSASCDSCHQVTGWKSATFSHAGVAAGSCTTCHNGGQARGMIANHVPTKGSCDVCHSTSTFTGAAMKHVGIATGCAACHDTGKTFFGVTMKSPPANHVPAGSAACETCHSATAFTTFGGTAMNHAPVAGTSCATCHEAGKGFFGVRMVTRPTAAQDPNHPPSGECGTCHLSTTSFSTNVSGGKPTNHVPTTQACALCHTNPAGYKPGVMNHAGISNGCATCHAASPTGIAFVGVTPVPQGGGHIPTTADCVSCHASTTKFGPGTAMNHAPVAATPCATCHETGKSFTGVKIVTRPTAAQDPAHPPTGECGTCHTSTTSFSAGVGGGKPANHIPTAQACTLCHANPASYKPGVMNHSGITGGCTTCHAVGATGTAFFGVTPLPQGSGHIPTSSDCATCHASTSKFGPGTPMSHTGISNGCATCHDTGKAFTGVTNLKTKPTNHVPTTATCETCHAPANFKTFAGTVMNHTGISSGCTTCHAASPTGIAFVGVTPVPQGSGHIPTTADCVTCHASTSKFGPGTPMQHTGITGNCASCHETGKSFTGVGNLVTRPTATQDPNHPPTGDCSTCHSSTTSFSTGVSGGKPANHIPTNAACTLCHTNPASYKPGVMNHSGITGGCTTCHAVGATGTPFYGVTPVPQGSGHIPTSSDCVTCHASTSKFGPGTPMSHTGISNGCATCHDTGKAFTGVTNLKTKPSNHVPTTAACETCHAAGNFTAFGPNTPMQHTGISSGCTTCHAVGATGTSFYGVTPVPQGSGHIPTTADCVTCHASTSKFGPGTPMQHTGITGNCANCHEKGKSFTGVTIVTRPTNPNHPPTGDCSTCHSSTTSFSTGVSDGKPANHIPTKQVCTLCHTNPASYKPGVMNHSGINSGCTTCHAVGATGTAFFGVTPLPQGSGHIPTTADCVTCHASTTKFGPGTPMSHTGISSGCATCHDTGKAFTGVTNLKTKPSNHVPTTAACETCHAASNFTAFGPNTPMQHTGISSGCTTCHAASPTGIAFVGVTPVPQGSGHIPTTADCVSCHASTSKFGPATPMNHAPVAGAPCATCHETGRSYFGVVIVTRPTAAQDPAHPPTGECGTCHSSTTSFTTGVTGKPANHIPTNAACTLCHLSLPASYKPGTMVHTGISSGCTTCHAVGATGTPFYGVTPVPQGSGHIPTTADCVTCHASTTKFGPGTPMSHSGISSGCATCHDSGKSFTGVVIKTKPSNHVPTTAACETCHAASNFTAFGPNTPMSHTGISSGCTTCHAASPTGIAFVGVTPVPQGSGHIPTTADCVTCHASTSKFGPGTPMQHTGITGNCASCHETGKSFTGVGNLVTRPTATQDPNHPPTGDCSTCHSSTTSFSTGVSGGKPANHIPTNAACTLCHTNPASYKPGVMNHSGINSGCTTCHAVGATGTAFFGVTPLPQGSGHIPTTADCVTCHASTTKFGPGTPMSHTGISSGCATCHDTGKAFTGVTNLKTKPSNHVPTTAACETCHAASNFTAFGPNTPMQHTGISSGCTTCHAASPTGIAFVGVTPVPQGSGHIPTTADCVSCHASTSKFGPATPMNHAPVAGAPCATCHETGRSYFGVVIVTRPTAAQDPAHPPTGECGTCHSSTTSFTTGVTGKPANHIPTNAACTLCHLSLPASYKPGTMVHTGISSGCTTCHAVGATGTPFYGVTPVPQGSGHIPTSSDCVTCHASTSKFGPGTPMSHTGISNGCATCHDTGKAFTGVTNLKTKPSNHVPTTAACETCHAASNFTAFGPNTPMSHTGISSGCTTCHAASVTGLVFAGVTPVPQGSGHIPTTADCVSCHASTSKFGPATPMNHAPVAGAPCATCHETGRSYFGVVIVTRPTAAQDPAHPPTGECGTCHSSTTSFTTGVTGKPANHIPTNAACTLCHLGLPASYKPGTMVHTGISSGCTTCHAVGATGTAFFGVTPLPQGSGHIPTTADCVTCHASTSKFGPGTPMSHTGISNGCATCHDTGKAFTGVTNLKTKPSNHVPTTAACETCHAASNFTAFGPNTPMQHTGISSGCTTCHAANVTGIAFVGVTPVPQGSGHIPTTADCVTCHASTSKFGPATPMNHAPVAGAPCATCHETGRSYFGVVIVTRPTAAQDPAHPPTGECGTCHSSTTSFTTGVTGKPANHIPTNAACTLCHLSLPASYKPGTMNHSGIASGCTTCHAAGASGTPFYGVTPVPQGSGHIPTSSDCVTCHASTTKFGPGTPMSHTGITSGCATCHDSGKSFTGVVIKTKPSNHVPTTAACETCHAASNFTAFGPNTPMSHTGISSGCMTCHAAATTGLVFAGVTPVPQGSGHIPTTADCVTCHASTSKFGPGTVMNHAPVAGAPCATCHETGRSYFGVVIVTRPTAAQDPAHPPTGECGTCHSSTTSFTTGVTGKPANHIPTNAACTLCHLSLPASYKPGTMNHSGIASGCTTCHAAGASGTPFYGVTPVPQGSGHIPTSSDCVTCHASTSKFGPGTPMSHTGITSGCATCHAAGKSFTGVTIKTPPATHIPIPGVACEGCHSPAAFTTFAGTSMNHVPVAAMTCMSCHETGMSWYGVSIVTRPRGHHTGVDCKGCHKPGPKFDDMPTPARVSTVLVPAPGAPPTANTSAPIATPIPRSPSPSRNFSHMGVAPNSCISCHNGSAAKGKPGKHLPTALSCDSCHRTTAWMPANFTHTGIAPSACATCHNGTGAKGKPANHFVTLKSCDSCHRTTSWTPVTSYAHVSPAFIRHNSGVACASCHKSNMEAVPWKFAGYKPDCAGCHAGRFKPEAHIKIESPRILYSMIELKNCTGACHVYANQSQTVVKRAIPSRHRSTDGGF